MPERVLPPEPMWRPKDAALEPISESERFKADEAFRRLLEPDEYRTHYDGGDCVDD